MTPINDQPADDRHIDLPPLAIDTMTLRAVAVDEIGLTRAVQVSFGPDFAWTVDADVARDHAHKMLSLAVLSDYLVAIHDLLMTRMNMPQSAFDYIMAAARIYEHDLFNCAHTHGCPVEFHPGTDPEGDGPAIIMERVGGEFIGGITPNQLREYAYGIIRASACATLDNAFAAALMTTPSAEGDSVVWLMSDVETFMPPDIFFRPLMPTKQDPVILNVLGPLLEGLLNRFKESERHE